MAREKKEKEVKLSVLERICKELNCNFADLVDYVDDSKVKKEKKSTRRKKKWQQEVRR